MAASLPKPLEAPEPEPETLEFEAVYRAHFAPAWRLLRRLGVAEAHLDDATQDVFLVVHRRLHEFEGSSKLRSWIFSIAVRVASDHRRRALRRSTEPLPEGVRSSGPCPARQSELRESVRVLHKLLEQMPDERRAIFVLAELEQMSAPEIATILEVKLNTVYSRLRAARQQFDGALSRYRAQQPGEQA